MLVGHCGRGKAMVLGSVGTIEIIRHGSEVPEARRDFLLDRIASIMASNWHFTQRHWSREDSPFHDEYGLVFASTNAEIVGYSIYKRVMLDGIPALYRGRGRGPGAPPESGLLSE